MLIADPLPATRVKARPAVVEGEAVPPLWQYFSRLRADLRQPGRDRDQLGALALGPAATIIASRPARIRSTRF
jgi:hypothetical protein